MDVSPPTPEAQAWRARWRRLRRFPLTMMIASLLLALGTVQLAFQIGTSVYRTVTWRQETAQVQVRVDTLQRDVQTLKDAQQAGSTVEYLRTLARCQGFVDPGELVVVASRAAGASGNICDSLRLP
ncbi:hypothetical protein SAMN04488058_10712 [Deinococcus reticulitermitis]|uniref:Cell division protein FtsB n=1 Tax=Deinococcus reticulitermitis TaxID=856736 RepID=A0A1H6YIZ3_9DEIO|nr:cell division protein FtsB [Deinococcus reticulitermitis]SEJ37190.1 hypothetical protein SAMN04488058_10712 [Deinococcus reticulitermitis]